MQRRSLDDLRIDTPCPKRWADLEGGDEKRFCDECGLHVVNLSALTRREAERTVRRRSAGERLCATFRRDRDGKLSTRAPVSWRQRLVTWSMSVLAAAGLAACTEDESASATETTAPGESESEELPEETRRALEELGGIAFLGYVGD